MSKGIAKRMAAALLVFILFAAAVPIIVALARHLLEYLA